MALDIEYFFAPQSPWAYLGHQRLWDLARAEGSRIHVLPVDLGGRVFPVSGGLPVNKRPPQRQAYRLLELKRFSEHLGLPLNPQPKFFPVASADEAAQLIIAVDMHDGTEAAMGVAGALMHALWVADRNIAHMEVLADVLREQGLPPQRLDAALTQAVHERYEADSARAVEAGVFGAPSYVIDGEIFWGQDRLDFVQRRLRQVASG